MDIYLTIEEKYLHAVNELDYGETPKALQLLNAIIADDPFYARVYYQLGKLYYYELNDYQAAGYNFKTCVELEPSFPDVYFHYLNLLVFLNMEKQAMLVIAKALTVNGVCPACIYDLEGLIAEKKKDWDAALIAYHKAFLEATSKYERDNIEQSMERIKAKKRQTKRYNYMLSE